MNDATADAIDRLQSIAAWLKEDPDNILFLDPDHVRILRDFLDGKYPKRLSGRVTVSEAKGPFEPRTCPGIPTDCCDFAVVSLLEGVEICRVWKEADARKISDLLNAAIDTAPTPSPDQIRREADDLCVVWSNEHRAWWRANSAGYVNDVRGAGVYSRDEAMSISRCARDGWFDGRRPDEIPVRVADLPQWAREALITGGGDDAA